MALENDTLPKTGHSAGEKGMETRQDKTPSANQADLMNTGECTVF